eukprot:IDg18297t1
MAVASKEAIQSRDAIVSNILDTSLAEVSNSLLLDPVALDEVLNPEMARDVTVDATRRQKRRISFGVDEGPAAQRSLSKDGARVDKTITKNPIEGPALLPMREVSSLRTLDATGPAKTVVVIHRSGRKTGRRIVMTSNPEAGELDAQYPTG